MSLPRQQGRWLLAGKCMGVSSARPLCQQLHVPLLSVRVYKATWLQIVKVCMPETLCSGACSLQETGSDLDSKSCGNVFACSIGQSSNSEDRATLLEVTVQRRASKRTFILREVG